MYSSSRNKTIVIRHLLCMYYLLTAFLTAWMGADPMISGEMPTVAVDTILPSGWRLRWRARVEDISSTAAAPSFRPWIQWYEFIVTPSGFGKSVTITECHSIQIFSIRRSCFGPKHCHISLLTLQQHAAYGGIPIQCYPVNPVTLHEPD